MRIRHFDGRNRKYQCAVVGDDGKVVRLFERHEQAKQFLAGNSDLGVSAESVREYQRSRNEVREDVAAHYRAGSAERMAAAAKRAELDAYYRQASALRKYARQQDAQRAEQYRAAEAVVSGQRTGRLCRQPLRNQAVAV